MSARERGFQQRVEVGQIWSLLTQDQIRHELQIDRIEAGIAYGTLVGSTRQRFAHVSSLSRGYRGARLVQNADGSAPPPKLAPERPADTKRETMHASEFVRTVAPRGQIRCNDRHMQALAMREANKSTTEIAAHFNVSKHRVHDWIARAREARMDAKNRQAM